MSTLMLINDLTLPMCSFRYQFSPMWQSNSVHFYWHFPFIASNQMYSMTLVALSGINEKKCMWFLVNGVTAKAKD